jgi:ATP-dependent Clp protease protease subunit
MIYKFITLFTLFTIFQLSYASNANIKTITLTLDNFVALRGPVTSTSISNLITEMISKRSDTLYIYLNTNGGSVDAGMKLVNVIQSLQDNNIIICCIADTAISMGFVIFQSCSNRYVTRHASLMQHQMSLSDVEGKIRDLNSYVKFVNSIEDEINQNQADRIGLSIEQFNEKIRDDWWLTAKQSILEKVADEIVNIKCVFENTEHTVTIMTFFGKLDIVYMKCPQVTSYVKILVNGNILTNNLDENITNEINSYINVKYVNNLKNEYIFKNNFDNHIIDQLIKVNDNRIIDQLIEININIFNLN